MVLAFVRHVRENKGQLLIRNTLITHGACFCTFIRHVRENKGHLYTHSEYPDYTWCLPLYIYTACEGK